MKRQPTVISTFAGCGGSSLGYKLAGFKELLAVEWDDDAVRTFRHNFPEVKVYHGDITKLSGGDCLSLAGISKRELDIFDGSPPCQGFSTAGRRNLNDQRSTLFTQFARLLAELQPKAFVMENVTGLIKGPMKGVYLTIIKTLRGCGYRAKGEVLNAKFFNVAQSRERIIIVGFRDDLNIEPSHPKPQIKPMTLSEALKTMSQAPDDHRMANARVLKYAPHHPGGWSTDISLLLKYTGRTSSGISLQWASFDKPIGTIIKQEICEAGIMHPNRQRYLSMNELKACASFPPEFEFFNRKNAVQRIGNCVPPNLMRAVAEHIKSILDTHGLLDS